jgi:cytochrome P450
MKKNELSYNVSIHQDVFAAGSETTATTTIWAMSELAKNPGVMRRAQSEVRRVLEGKTRVAEADIQGRLPYLQAVIREALRLHPPLPLILPRSCAEPITILGHHVPEGTTVFVNAWAIGRDERWWPDASQFKPERFEGEGVVDFSGADFRFLPGGGGRRMCPGLTFGMANVEIALASLLYHFDWELPGGADSGALDMSEAYGITARRKTDLVLKATPFVPFPRTSAY